MNPAAAAIMLASVSTAGFTIAAALPPPTPTDVFPWKDIAGGGAALLLLAALVVFLRFLREERTDRIAERGAERTHIEKVVGDCTTVIGKCNDTVVSLQRQAATDAAEMRQLVRDVHSHNRAG